MEVHRGHATAFNIVATVQDILARSDAVSYHTNPSMVSSEVTFILVIISSHNSFIDFVLRVKFKLSAVSNPEVCAVWNVVLTGV